MLPAGAKVCDCSIWQKAPHLPKDGKYRPRDMCRPLTDVVIFDNMSERNPYREER